MEKLSPLLNVVQNEHCRVGTAAKGFISLASKPRMPRVHKLCWKDDKCSRDWLKRISDINSSLAVDAQPRNDFDEELFYNIEGASETPDEERGIDLTDECFHGEPFSLDPEVPNNCQSRKPDSTYISTISQINVSICISEVSKRRCVDFDDDDLTPAFLLQSKIDEFPGKFLQVNDPSPQSVFFSPPTEGNVQAKRKLSFEYIQEVSLLQYGHNLAGDFRR